MAVGRRPVQHHRMVFNAIRFFILLTSMWKWKRERELWMRPRTLEGWENEVLPETVQHQKNLQYLSATVRPFWRWNDWRKSRREEKELNRKRRRPKSASTTSFRLLTALSLLLIMAGDVELNPGPLFTGQLSALLPTTDDTVLGEDEVFLVYEALFPKAAMWRNIGMALGVQMGDLDTIDATYPCKPSDCLRSVLERWVRKGYCVERHGLPTWQKVVEAVARPAGGNDNALAEGIAKSHQVHMNGSSTYTAAGIKRVPIKQSPETIKWNHRFQQLTSKLVLDLPNKLKKFLLSQSHILYPEFKYINTRLLSDAGSIEDIFSALSPQYMNYLNWSLLLQIADTFNPQSRHTIEEYTSQFPPSTRLKTLPDPLSEDEIVELHGVKRLTVTCGGGGSDWTLGDVRRVQEVLEKATGIDRTFLPFAYWESGYRQHQFTFLIPESAVGILEDLCKEDLKVLANCDVRAIEIDYSQVLSISNETAQPPVQIQDERRVRTKDFGLEHLIPEDAVRQMNREEFSRLTNLLTSTPQGKLQGRCLDEDLHDLAISMQSWKDLAPYLGVNEWRVEEIEENYPNEDDQKYLALICWKGMDPSAATYESLVECLMRHGHVRDAGYLLGSLSLGLPPFVQRAQDELRKRYTEAHSMGSLWPGAPNLMEFNQSLAIIPVEHDARFDPKEEIISVKDFLTRISEANKSTFIIMGPRGFGKTVQMKQICAYWAKQYTLREFPLVLYIDAKSTRSNGTLHDYVQSQFPDVVTKDVWQWIYKREGKGVLFIMDGYEGGKDVDADLKLSTMISTCTHLPSRLLGLSDTQIAKQAVVSLGPDQAGDFLLYLSENLVIKTLVSSPVYLAAVIYVFTHVQPDRFPTTLTQMFASLTYLLALNACKKELQLPVGFTPQMLVQYCQETGNQADVTQIIQQMCQLAMENEVFQLHQQGQLQGAFLHRSSENSQFFTFTVPLLQDFLAALQIHIQSLDEKLISMSYDEFPRTWQFYAGLSNITTTEFQYLLEDHLEDEMGIVKCLLESAGGDVMKLEPTLCVTPNLMEEACTVHCIAQSCGCLPHTQYDSYDSILELVSVWELSKCLASPCCLLDNTRCTITVLNLRGNEISDDGASALGEVLKMNKSLMELNLSRNEISDVGASVLGDMLKANRSLVKLDLSENEISDRGASALGEMLKVNQSLVELDLSRNEITDDGASALGEMLKMNESLVELALNGNPISPEVMGVTLMGNKSLVKLIENLVLHELMQSPEILNLSGNEIIDDVASVLGEMLKANESLKELDLSGNEITDTGASALGEMLKLNQSLVKLDLSRNEITDDGASALGEMLKMNESLKELNLSEIEITDTGASALGEMLKVNQSLVKLDLSINKISDDGASALGEMLKVNRSLMELNLSEIEITDVGASALGEMLKVNQSLVKLDLSRNEITDDGASALGEMLKMNESLKELNLSGNEITDAGAALGEMLKVNQSLVKLDLSDNEMTDDGGVVLGEMLKMNESLKELNLMGNRISDRGALALGEMLKVNQSLKELSLSCNNSIYDRGATALGEMLKVNQALETLNLMGNRISDRGASALGEMMKVNQSLKKFNLSCNWISDRGASALGEMLKVNQALETLNLMGNEISDRGASALGEMLKGNQSLKELNLSCNNRISDRGASALGEMLKVNQALETLLLIDNEISDGGASTLAEMLKVNRSLIELNLSGNRISKHGASLLRGSLKGNQSLKKLDLDKN